MKSIWKILRRRYWNEYLIKLKWACQQLAYIKKTFFVTVDKGYTSSVYFSYLGQVQALKTESRVKTLRSNMRARLININPEILSGIPVFNGTRVPVQSLFDWLETETLDEFLENFPSVSRSHAIQVLKLAVKLVADKGLLNEATA